MTSIFEVIILLAEPALNQKEFDVLLPLVSLEKQERIKRFRLFRDIQNALLGDILARVAICRATGLSNKQLEISTNSYGKPFLTNQPHIHYNISHAGYYIACVLDNQPVGIDIELIKTADLKIAERFFTPDETAYIVSPNDDLIDQRFFEVWTKKESRIKWEGKGLSKPLSSFSVVLDLKRNSIFYHQVFHNGEAIGHVCSAKREPPIVKVIDTATLLGYIK